jgi:hypothetical protein
MFEGLVSGILKKYLGQFIVGLDANNLGISVFSGKLKLENLQINPQALENAGLKLPITIKSGVLGKLEISGLKNMTTKPVSVVIEDIYLVLCPNSAFDWTEEDEANSQLATKRGQLEKRMEDAKNAEEAEKKANEELSWAEKFAAKIVDNLQLDIKRIHVRYEDSTTCPGTTFAIGLTLRSLSVFSTDSKWNRQFVVGEEVVHKMLSLEEVSMYFRVNATLYEKDLDKMKDYFEESSSSSSSSSTALALNAATSTSLRQFWEKDVLIPPISFLARVSMCKTEKDLSRAKIQVTQVIDHVRIIFSRRQYQLLMELLKYFDSYSATTKNRQYRPHVPVHGNVKLWWKFALKCILAERRGQHLEKRRKLWVLAKTDKYIALHERSMTITEEWMSNPTKEQWEELTKIEDDPRMRYEDIIKCRSLVEAKVLHRLQFQTRNKSIKPWQLQLRRQSKNAKSSKGNSAKQNASQKKDDEKRAAKEAKRVEKERKKEEAAKLKKKKKNKKSSGGGWFSRKKKKNIEEKDESSDSEEDEEGAEPAVASSSFSSASSSSSSSSSSAIEGYQLSNEDREKLFRELNFDPETAAKDQAERMRTLPSSYQLANCNINVKMISFTLIDDMRTDTKEAILRLEVPLTRLNLTVKNGLMNQDGAPVPNLILRAKLPDLVVRDFTNKSTLFPDIIKRASTESSFGEDNDPSGLDALPGDGDDITDSALLEMLVDVKPVDGSCDTRVNLTLEPLCVVFSKTAIARLGQFFTVDSGDGGFENLVLAANQRAQEISDAQLEAINAAIEAHTTLLIDIKIDAPIVIVPENPNKVDTLGIVADLGRFELHTSPQIETMPVSSSSANDDGSIGATVSSSGETKTAAAVGSAVKDEDEEEEEQANTTNADFQRRNIGQLTTEELEKKYDHFYFTAQSIAIRVGTLDLRDRQKEIVETARDRRPSQVTTCVPSSALKKNDSTEEDYELDALNIGKLLFKGAASSRKGKNLMFKKGDARVADYLQQSIAQYSMCTPDMFATIDMYQFLLSFYTFVDPSKMKDIKMMTPLFTEHPQEHFTALIKHYDMPLPSPEVLVQHFDTARNLASNAVVTFASEHRMFRLGGRANAQAHTCSLPLEISKIMGFPKAIVKAYVPPVVVDLNPLALLDTLQIVNSVTKEEEKDGTFTKDESDKASMNTAASTPNDMNIAGAAVDSTTTTTTTTMNDNAILEDEDDSKKLPVNLILDVMVSEVSVNFLSVTNAQLLAVAVRNTSSHLYMRGTELYSNSSISSIVIENRRAELDKLSSNMLQSPIERAARRLQNSYRQKLRARYPKRYAVEDALRAKPLLEGGDANSARSMTSTPFVQVSVTQKGPKTIQEDGITVVKEVGTTDVSTRVTTLHIGLSNTELLVLWNELAKPILSGMKELKVMDQVTGSANSTNNNQEDMNGLNDTNQNNSEQNEVKTVLSEPVTPATPATPVTPATPATPAASAVPIAQQQRITFFATWDTINIALKANNVPIAYARLHQFSASGVIEADNSRYVTAHNWFVVIYTYFLANNVAIIIVSLIVSILFVSVSVFDSTDVRIATRSFVVDDIDVDRPPLLSLSPLQTPLQRSKPALRLRYQQHNNESMTSGDDIEDTDASIENTVMDDLEVQVDQLRLAVHPGFALDIMRKFVKPVIASMLVVTRDMQEMGVMGDAANGADSADGAGGAGGAEDTLVSSHNSKSEDDHIDLGSVTIEIVADNVETETKTEQQNSVVRSSDLTLNVEGSGASPSMSQKKKKSKTLLRIHGAIPRIDISVYSAIDSHDKNAPTFLTYLEHLKFDVQMGDHILITTSNNSTNTANTANSINTYVVAGFEKFGCSVPPVQYLDARRSCDSVLQVSDVYAQVTLSTLEDGITSATHVNVLPGDNENAATTMNAGASVCVGVTLPALVALTEIMPTVTTLNEEALSLLEVRAQLPEEALFVTKAATSTKARTQAVIDENQNNRSNRNMMHQQNNETKKQSSNNSEHGRTNNGASNGAASKSIPKDTSTMSTASTTSTTSKVTPSELVLSVTGIGVSINLCHTLQFGEHGDVYDDETKGETKTNRRSGALFEAGSLPFVGIDIVNVDLNLNIKNSASGSSDIDDHSTTMTTTTIASVRVDTILGLLHCATPHEASFHQLISFTDQDCGAITLSFNDCGNGMTPSSVDVQLVRCYDSSFTSFTFITSL